MADDLDLDEHFDFEHENGFLNDEGQISEDDNEINVGEEHGHIEGYSDFESDDSEASIQEQFLLNMEPIQNENYSDSSDSDYVPSDNSSGLGYVSDPSSSSSSDDDDDSSDSDYAPSSEHSSDHEYESDPSSSSDGDSSDSDYDPSSDDHSSDHEYESDPSDNSSGLGSGSDSSSSSSDDDSSDSDYSPSSEHSSDHENEDIPTSSSDSDSSDSDYDPSSDDHSSDHEYESDPGDYPPLVPPNNAPVVPPNNPPVIPPPNNHPVFPPNNHPMVPLVEDFDAQSADSNVTGGTAASIKRKSIQYPSPFLKNIYSDFDDRDKRIHLKLLFHDIYADEELLGKIISAVNEIGNLLKAHIHKVSPSILFCLRGCSEKKVKLNELRVSKYVTLYRNLKNFKCYASYFVMVLILIYKFENHAVRADCGVHFHAEIIPWLTDFKQGIDMPNMNIMHRVEVVTILLMKIVGYKDYDNNSSNPLTCSVIANLINAANGELKHVGTARAVVCSIKYFVRAVVVLYLLKYNPLHRRVAICPNFILQHQYAPNLLHHANIPIKGTPKVLNKWIRNFFCHDNTNDYSLSMLHRLQSWFNSLREDPPFSIDGYQGAKAEYVQLEGKNRIFEMGTIYINEQIKSMYEVTKNMFLGPLTLDLFHDENHLDCLIKVILGKKNRKLFLEGKEKAFHYNYWLPGPLEENQNVFIPGKIENALLHRIVEHGNIHQKQRYFFLHSLEGNNPRHTCLARTDWAKIFLKECIKFEKAALPLIYFLTGFVNRASDFQRIRYDMRQNLKPNVFLIDEKTVAIKSLNMKVTGLSEINSFKTILLPFIHVKYILGYWAIVRPFAYLLLAKIRSLPLQEHLNKASFGGKKYWLFKCFIKSNPAYVINSVKNYLPEDATYNMARHVGKHIYKRFVLPEEYQVQQNYDCIGIFGHSSSISKYYGAEKNGFYDINKLKRTFNRYIYLCNLENEIIIADNAAVVQEINNGGPPGFPPGFPPANNNHPQGNHDNHHDDDNLNHNDGYDDGGGPDGGGLGGGGPDGGGLGGGGPDGGNPNDDNDDDNPFPGGGPGGGGVLHGGAPDDEYANDDNDDENPPPGGALGGGNHQGGAPGAGNPNDGDNADNHPPGGVHGGGIYHGGAPGGGNLNDENNDDDNPPPSGALGGGIYHDPDEIIPVFPCAFASAQGLLQHYPFNEYQVYGFNIPSTYTYGLYPELYFNQQYHQYQQHVPILPCELKHQGYPVPFKETFESYPTSSYNSNSKYNPNTGSASRPILNISNHVSSEVPYLVIPLTNKRLKKKIYAIFDDNDSADEDWNLKSKKSQKKQKKQK